jgi:hypothetical protein
VCTIWFHFSSIKYSPHSFYWFFFHFLDKFYFSISSLIILLHLIFIPDLILILLITIFFFWITGNFTYWFLRVCLIWSNLVSWSGSWVLKIDSFWLYFFNFILRYRLLGLQFMIFFTFLWGYHNLISQVMG